MGDSASADGTWQQVVNGNISGESIQFDYQGGSANNRLNVIDGSTVTVLIDNTIVKPLKKTNIEYNTK